MKKILILIFLIFGFGLYTLNKSNVFKDISQEVNFTCSVIEEIQGPEDIDKAGDTLIISSAFHKPAFHKYDGKIYKYKTGELELMQVEVPINPHGISVFGDLLAMVSHDKESDSIKIFEMSGKKLILKNNLTDEKLYNGNDIVFINEKQFFVTIDHSLKTDFSKILENTIQFPGGKVLFYDGENFHEVIEGIVFANGIQFKKNKIYISSMIGKKIYVYNIENPLKPKEEKVISLDEFPDNLHIEDERLLITTHQKIFTLKAHSEQPKRNHSKSSLYEYNLSNGSLSRLSTFPDSYSALSVTVPFENEYVLGNIYSEFLLRCKK